MSSIVCTADIHINCKRTPGFMRSRVIGLAEVLLEEATASNSLYILGDIFDISNPSLDDIRLFYNFIEIVSTRYTDIRIINGNHDARVFLSLPEVNFKYYHDITYDGDMCFMGWSNLQLINSVKKTRILFTHARCTIPPFITEEISFELLAKKADLVILGDIHHDCATLSNIYYCYEPSRNTYTTHHNNSTGYLIVDTETLEVTRRHPKLPHKELLKFGSMAEYLAVKELYYKEPNLYKIIITDYIENLKVIGVANALFELNPRVIVEEKPLKEEEELKEIISQRVSISEALLVHTQESYRFSLDVLNKIKKRLRG